MKNIIILIIGLLLIGSAKGSPHSGWDSQSEVLAKVSTITGVPLQELATVAALESSFRPWVHASTSSATGLFQFTERTWRVTLKSYGSLYGLSANASRKDPYANALMGAEYLKENKRVLERKLDRIVSLADVYMAHLIAPRRVAALDDINPKAKITTIYPNLARRNHALFYDDTGRSKSVKYFIRSIHAKVWRTYHAYDRPSQIAMVSYQSKLDRLDHERAYAAMRLTVTEPPAYKAISLRFKDVVKGTLTLISLVPSESKRKPEQYAVNTLLYFDRRWTA